MADYELREAFTTTADLGLRFTSAMSDDQGTCLAWGPSTAVHERPSSHLELRFEGGSRSLANTGKTELEAPAPIPPSLANNMTSVSSLTLSLQAIVGELIDGTEAFEITGDAFGDRFGRVVTGGVDFNNDGIDDVMVGADKVKIAGLGSAGAVYVFFGGQKFIGSQTAASLADLRIDGVQQNGRLGFDLDGISDINMDGISDLIIGARLARPNGVRNEGEVYVVFGSDSQDQGTAFQRLDSTNGFSLNGTGQGSKFGKAVSGLGDINGDGIPDIAASAHLAANKGDKNAGKTFIIFGGQEIDSHPQLRDFDGIVFRGSARGDGSGRSVDGIGDINGDGIDDLIIGAPTADGLGGRNSGEAYIVFGSEDFSRILAPSRLDGGNGFRLSGEASDDRFGYHVAGIGDLNNDGIQDFAIGARQADPLGREDAGVTYVIYGGQDFSSVITLDDLQGFRVLGASPGDNAGFSLSAAGDVNGDGIDDLLIGARFADVEGLVDAGEAYLIFGSTNLPNVIDLADNVELATSETSAFIRFQGYVPGQQVGASVSAAGDHNNDGFDDIIIGGPEAGGGSAFVIYGSDGFWF